VSKLGNLLLKRLRWVIVGIGLLLGVALFIAGKNAAPTAWGGLLINLSASAITVAFTALIVDWLYERRQRLLVARPLEFARHELGTVCFMIGNILGKPYLANFNSIVAEWVETKDLTMDGLAVFRKKLINALGELAPEDCPPTTPELAAILSTQLTERVTAIDEVLRLYGFALDTELRDSVYLLRDRMISLSNSLSVFSMGSGVQNERTMHDLVGMGIQGVAEAVKATDAEWAHVKKIK
jgi:hypothetical protein